MTKSYRQNIFPLVARMMYIFLFSIIASGCGQPPSRQSVSGIYIGKYSAGVETLRINSNGTYSQVFEVNGNIEYANQGTWTIDGSTMHFHDFVIASEQVFPTSLLDKIDVYSVSMTSKSSQIIFDQSTNYIVYKK